MIDGLLHIGGMAVLAGTGYLGLEKIGSTENILEEHLAHIKSEVHEELTKLDYDPMNPEDGVLFSAFDNDEAHLLMDLDGRNCDLYDKKPSASYPKFKKKNTRFMSYFRDGTHKKYVFLFTSASIVLFLSIIGATLFLQSAEQIEGVIAIFAEIITFLIFAGTLLLVFGNALCAHEAAKIRAKLLEMLKRLKEKIVADENKIKARLKVSMSETVTQLSSGDKHLE